MDRLPPAAGLVPGRLRVLPEAAPVVDRAEALPQVVLGHALQHDPAPEEHLPESRAFLLQERDHLQRKVEAVLGAQSAHLERGDDPHRPVVAAAVAVRVAVGADAEDVLARGTVTRDERPERVLGDGEAELLERRREVVERPAVLRGVRVAADRLAAGREVRAGERLDLALDPGGAPLAIDSRDHRSDPTPVPRSARRARDEGLVREQALDAAHAPVRTTVLGEERRHAGDARGLRVPADGAEPLDVRVVVRRGDRRDRVEARDTGRARRSPRRSRCRAPRRRTPRRARA